MFFVADKFRDASYLVNEVNTAGGPKAKAAAY